MSEMSGSNVRAVETDLAGFLTTMLTEVCLGREDQHPLEATIAGYFHPDYQQWTDDGVIGYDEFVAHMRALRARVATGEVRVLQAHRNGYRITARHVVRHVRLDGSEACGEVLLRGEFASDFRLRWMTETTEVGTATREGYSSTTADSG